MKRIVFFLLTAVTGLILLAACAPADSPAIEQEPETISEPTIDKSDLTMIGNTGRPQLLNAFASW